MPDDAPLENTARLVVREYDSTRRITVSSNVVFVPVNHDVTAGRTLDETPDRLRIGMEPLDTGVSRDALIVTARPQGFDVTVFNKRGAMLHPWGLAPTWLECGASMLKHWPLLGVRVAGSVPGLEHWLLLENDAYRRHAPSGPDVTDDTVSRTNIRQPPPLTDKQLAAVRGVFSQHLEWPVRSAPQPAKLQSVARALGISDTGVTERLEGAKAKARGLGLHEQAGLTQPDYLHALVANGYLEPPTISAEAAPPT